jgi:hypothetical protein
MNNTYGSNSNSGSLAPHEAIELREFLTSQLVGVKKLKSTINMIQDPELKGFAQAVLDSKINSISEVENFTKSTNIVQ